MSPVYPHARTVHATESLAGVSFPDPYRWLEETSDEVRSWQRAQAAMSSAYVQGWPRFPQVRRLVGQLESGRQTSLPRYAGGQWFRIRFGPGAAGGEVVVSDAPFGLGRVLFNSSTENEARSAFLSWIAPSPDGRTLAIGVCVDGSENNSILLVDVSSGSRLPGAPTQILMDNWTGGVSWLKDSSGFFFSAFAGPVVDFEQGVYLHRRSPSIGTELVNIEWPCGKDYRVVLVCGDGKYAVAYEGVLDPIPIAIVKIERGILRWRPFVTSLNGFLAGHLIGDEYIAVTQVGAPRGRVVSVPVDSEDPSNPCGWRELVAESDSVLLGLVPVGDVLYLNELMDTYSRVRIINRDGTQVGEVPLPGPGAVLESAQSLARLVPRGHPDKFLFTFSTLTTSPGTYSHSPGEERIEILQAPEVELKNVVVEDHWAQATDGARIPYHVVHRADLSTDKPQPTLIYAYGAHGSSLLPQFPGAMAAFIAAGGMFVHAHLRGGGEFGSEWWEQGRRRNKQNSYNDLYRVAESLIAEKRCEPGSLAFTGLSAGGLLAGVALTQRPDLWAVVVCRVPPLDLIAACRYEYGRMCTLFDRADVDDPEEVLRLSTFSPYHLVREGVRYPAVYVDAGDTDPRCPAWHARKFVARLQAAADGEAPILLHVWEDVGHGGATAKDVAVAEHSEWLAFAMRQLGLEPGLDESSVLHVHS